MITFLVSLIMILGSYIVIRCVFQIVRDERAYQRGRRFQREQQAFSYLWPHLREVDKEN